MTLDEKVKVEAETLKKAVTQKTLTADTVDTQFCSDWLKEQMKGLFTHLAEKDAEIARLKDSNFGWQKDAMTDGEIIDKLELENTRLEGLVEIARKSLHEIMCGLTTDIKRVENMTKKLAYETLTEMNVQSKLTPATRDGT